MWSYYGSKAKLAKFYPPPEYDLIIEPFAGAAWYSVLYRSNHILLNEKYRIIYDIWKWLINEATSDLLINNADFYSGQDISKIDIVKPHKDLIGFCINRGSIEPKNIVQKWSCQVKSRPDWASTTYYRLHQIAQLLPEIRHWKVNYGDYKELSNVEATWFIDPPYQSGGQYYISNAINYNELAEWCKSRKGQIIVCENDNATWMDFEPLIDLYGQSHKTTEVIWHN